MADAAAEARIRDLKRRLELDPGSRLFVALAEEYRKSGRHVEALSTLQQGLLAHPHYLSAQVALGRAYLEAGQITEAIATFSKTLTADPGNLVSARSLAEIYLSRGESVEAIKKFKLYRALSGDRAVDDTIERLEVELAPPPPPPPGAITGEVPPPPTFFEQRETGRTRRSRDTASSRRRPEPLAPVAAAADAVDMTPVAFEPDDSGSRKPEVLVVPGFVSRDTPLAGVVRELAPETPPPPPVAAPEEPAAPAPVDAAQAVEPASEVPPPQEPPPAPVEPVLDAAPPFAPPRPAEEFATRAFRISEVLEPPREAPPSGPLAEAEPPRGRVLADLYYAQGHYAEALRIYDDLVAAHPGDLELKARRRDAEARLLPGATTPEAAAPDPVLARRLARIRVLKRWLGVVQTG